MTSQTNYIELIYDTLVVHVFDNIAFLEVIDGSHGFSCT